MISNKKTIICIPGLGGHPSAFDLYKTLMPEFNFRCLEITNIENALAILQKMLAEEGNAVLFCSCYGIQLALRVAALTPHAVDGIILIEPFFAEFHWWRTPLLWIARAIFKIAKITDTLGWKRRSFNFHPNYVELAKYPIYFQPFFDIFWHNLTDYFGKICDLLSFQLPDTVSIPTLIIVAPDGFMRNKRHHLILSKIFSNSTVATMSDGNHNIITMSSAAVARIADNWINNKLL